MNHKNQPKNPKNPLTNYLYFGIDELEFNVGYLHRDFLYYDELVWNLDQDNSNVGYIELFDQIFSYKIIRVPGFDPGLIFETAIDGYSVPCFALLPGKPLEFKKHLGKSKDKVVIYSSFFVLDHLQAIPFTIREFLGHCFLLENSLLYRLDICLDVPYTIKELSPIFIDMQKPSSAIGTDKKNPEFYQTYYLGEVQNSLNKNSLIRIYDKVLDTWKKHKAFLYPHLQNNKDVRRIELELRPEQAKRYHDIHLIDLVTNQKDILGDIFAYYINRKVPEKYYLEKKDLILKTFPKRAFDMKEAFLQYGHIPKDYLKRVYGYIKKTVHNTGYNGLFQLLFNQQHIDIFLQKNIKSCVSSILENKPYSLVLTSNPTTNQDTALNSSYDFLESLIIYMNNPKNGLNKKRINKILKTHLIPLKVKL